MSYQYFDGIPSSLVAYSSERGRIQTYDNIYDVEDNTNLLINQLQNQLTELQTEVNVLEALVKSGTIGASNGNPNLIANADCSQWSLAWPIRMSSGATNKNESFMMQGNALPLMDRWYHVAELCAFRPNGFYGTAERVLLSNYVPGGSPPEESYPHRAKYGMLLSYFNVDNVATPVFTLEHTIGVPDQNRYASMFAIQHTIPDVTRFANVTLELGFWLWTNNVDNAGFIRIARQYRPSHTGPARSHTEGALESLLFQTFELNYGWNYITKSIPMMGLALPVSEGIGNNGLMIQIGPLNYAWNILGYTIYGDAVPFTKPNPGLQWVLAEMHARIDGTKPTPENFPTGFSEYERTSPYVTVANHLHPEEIRTYTPYGGFQFFPTGFVRELSIVENPGGSGFYDHEISITVPLSFQTRLLTATPTANNPVTVYMCSYNKNGVFGGLNPLHNVRFRNADTVTGGNSVETVWGTTDFSPLTVSVRNELGTIENGTAPAKLQIDCMGNRFAMLRATLTYNWPSTEKHPSNTQISFNPSNRYVWFVFMVRETPDQTKDRGQVEFMTYPDTTFTALGARLLANVN